MVAFHNLASFAVDSCFRGGIIVCFTGLGLEEMDPLSSQDLSSGCMDLLDISKKYQFVHSNICFFLYLDSPLLPSILNFDYFVNFFLPLKYFKGPLKSAQNTKY